MNEESRKRIESKNPEEQEKRLRELQDKYNIGLHPRSSSGEETAPAYDSEEMRADFEEIELLCRLLGYSWSSPP